MKLHKLTNEDWAKWRSFEERDALRLRLLQSFKDELPVQLRAPTGMMLGVLRTAGHLVRGDAPTVTEILNDQAVAPEDCDCSSWTKNDPCQHHPVCVKRHDWENSQRAKASRAALQPPTASCPPVDAGGVAAATGGAAAATGGAVAGGEDLAPIARELEQEEPATIAGQSYVFTADGLRLRPASPEEIAQANEREKLDGWPIFMIGEACFYVGPSTGWRDVWSAPIS